jgi:hypothetical protein
MFIPDPDFYQSRIPGLESRIPGPTTTPNQEGEFLFVLLSYFLVKMIFYLPSLHVEEGVRVSKATRRTGGAWCWFGTLGGQLRVMIALEGPLS